MLLEDDVAKAYAQFGPLTAYPARSGRATSIRRSPMRRCPPSSPASRRPRTRAIAVWPRRLIAAVCDDLTGRGFTAVETYPEIGARPDATSAATPRFWESVGFADGHRRRAIPGHAPRPGLTAERWRAYPDATMAVTNSSAGARPVRAPRGTEMTCRGWAQEAALRMLMNNLDPEVAEDPDHLVVYGGTGRAARSWDAFDAIVRELRELADDETLLVQSGKPVGVVRTHPWAPRVLIANSNLVGKWATWEVFRELEQAGLMMYGQMTAGSWIYIGTQGILQGTYETFAEAARQHFGGTLRGTVTLTAGLGGMGGAQPLAVTMNEGVCIAIEVDEARARRRLDIGYVDRLTGDPAEALRWAREAAAAGQPLSIALVGNAAEIEPAWAAAGERFDLVTDQTSAHDALGGYVPDEMTLADALELRAALPDEYQRRSGRAMAAHVRAMLAFQRAGVGRLRLRQQPAGPGPGSGRPRRVRLPGLRARLSSGHSSARAAARSAGWRCRATRPTSRGPIARCSSCSPRTPGSDAGSRWPRSESRSRACRHGSAGSATESGHARASPSTSWSAPARSAHRS